MDLPKSAQQFEQYRAFFARTNAQIGMAQTQLVKDRNLRVMGALADATPKRKEKMVTLALRAINICNKVLETYFMIRFERYWRLRQRYEKQGNDRKAIDITRKLFYFESPYCLFKENHESACRVFDVVFNQWHTVSTMMELEKEKEEETRKGITWVASDLDRMKSKLKSQQAVRHDESLDTGKPTKFPTFYEAVEIARTRVEGLLKSFSVEEERPKPAESREPKIRPKKIPPAMNTDRPKGVLMPNASQQEETEEPKPTA